MRVEVTNHAAERYSERVLKREALRQQWSELKEELKAKIGSSPKLELWLPWATRKRGWLIEFAPGQAAVLRASLKQDDDALVVVTVITEEEQDD